MHHSAFNILGLAERPFFRKVFKMQNFFLLIAGMGLFYTTLTGTLYDMTVADCNAGIELACKELQQ